MKQVLIKLEFKGGFNKKKINIEDLQEIVEGTLCRGIEGSKYKLVITKPRVNIFL